MSADITATSADQTLQVMSLYNQLWRPGGPERAERVIAPHFMRYGSSGQFSGISAFKRYVQHYLTAFPDLRLAVEGCVAQSAQVVLRYSFTGTHEHHFMGVPGTQRPVWAEGAAVYRMADGLIVELWDFLDLFGLARQLDVGMHTLDPESSWK